MNSIRQTQLLNKRELASAVPPSASWHADYRDTAYIYIGGFPFDLSEGDLLTIFSQYGNPTHLNLIRDRETGKSKGFAFLKYEDQRSCDLAVDNLGGAEVLGRMLRVDHTRYKKREDEDEGTWRLERLEGEGVNGHGNEKSRSWGEETDDGSDDKGKRKRRKRGVIKEEERELEHLLRVREGEEEDPMRQYLIEEKKGKLEQALARIEQQERHPHKHRHDKDKDREGGRGRRSHRRRADAKEDRPHRHHHREDADRDPGSRRMEKDDREQQPPSHQQRTGPNSDRSRSRSRSWRRRGRTSPEATPSKRSPTRHEHTLYRRRDPKDDRTPSRSPSRSLSRERRRNRR